VREGRNRFFLKKKAKTFFSLGARWITSAAPMDKSFLVLFFKKELHPS
jgi:hypothetical protein